MKEGYNSWDCLTWGKGLREDMAEVYRIMHGLEKVDRETFPPSPIIREPKGDHPMKLIGWEIQDRKWKEVLLHTVA